MKRGVARWNCQAFTHTVQYAVIGLLTPKPDGEVSGMETCCGRTAGERRHSGQTRRRWPWALPEIFLWARMNEVCHDSGPLHEPKMGVYWAGLSRRAVHLRLRPPQRSHPNSCHAKFFSPSRNPTTATPLPRFRVFPALSSSSLTRGRTRNSCRRPPGASQKCSAHSAPRRRWPPRGEHCHRQGRRRPVPAASPSRRAGEWRGRGGSAPTGRR
jgi:hypothetical protein